jgi:uncharacterized membrane protein HdeD (DUF308 family)
MTQTASSTPTSAPTGGTTSGLRSLSLIRLAFSVIWVALILAGSTPFDAAEKPAAFTAVLLVLYPLWDAAATFIARRIDGAGSPRRIGTVNIVLGLAATVAMIVAVASSFGAALLVFGLWALLSGALQLTVALQRRRTVGAQWPQMVSGGLSVFAGASMAAMSFSGTHSLVLVAGYSAFGAFWFLVSAVALTIRGRRITRSLV